MACSTILNVTDSPMRPAKTTKSPAQPARLLLTDWCTQATNDGNKCETLGVCETCSPGPKFAPGNPDSNCTAIKTESLWTLAEYGYVLGGKDVDAEGVDVGSEQKVGRRSAGRLRLSLIVVG